LLCPSTGVGKTISFFFLGWQRPNLNTGLSVWRGLNSFFRTHQIVYAFAHLVYGRPTVGNNGSQCWWAGMHLNSFLSLRVFSSKTDDGYPKHAGVAIRPGKPWDLPLIIKHICHLHQSPQLPVPGDLGRGVPVTSQLVTLSATHTRTGPSLLGGS